jgi:intracellular septation protein A
MDMAAIKDRLRRVWTYRWSVTVDGRRYDVRLESGWRTNTFAVASNGEERASEVLDFYAEPFRLQELAVKDPSGGLLTFRTGPHSIFTYGLEVVRDGSVVHRSHPEPFAAMGAIEKISNFGWTQDSRQDPSKEDSNLPAGQARLLYAALAADVCVSALLYFAAGYMSLRNVALLGAAVVLAMMLADWTAERFFNRKLNLTGGFSALGIVMLLLSAGFAWLVDNELAIMLKSSVLGLISAAVLAGDAVFGGRYIGERASQLITFVRVDPRRWSWGTAMAVAGQSLLSAAIALWLSRDAWLFYKHWVASALAFGLGMTVLWVARRRTVLAPADRTAGV